MIWLRRLWFRFFPRKGFTAGGPTVSFPPGTKMVSIRMTGGGGGGGGSGRVFVSESEYDEYLCEEHMKAMPALRENSSPTECVIVTGEDLIRRWENGEGNGSIAASVEIFRTMLGDLKAEYAERKGKHGHIQAT